MSTYCNAVNTESNCPTECRPYWGELRIQYYPNHLLAQNVFGVSSQPVQKGFVNPFLDNVPILYPLKTTEEFWFSCFYEV